MDELHEGEFEAFLTGLFAIAWADREVQPEEQELLQRLVDEMHIPDGMRAKLNRWLQHPVALDNVPWETIPVEGQAFLYRSAIQVAKADGVVKPTEREALAKMRNKLSVPRDALEAIERDEVVPPERLEL